eukprot:986298-Heterocapsa_arctica.AAC.1
MGICHSRGLAYQIKHEYERFAKYCQDVEMAVVYSGTPVAKDKEMLKENCPHILIGTPGRVFAFLRNKDLKLDKLPKFVLEDLKLDKLPKIVWDECDRCQDKLDMRKDIQTIF